MKIILKKLTKTYRDAGRSLTVLDGVDFEFASGKMTAIVGRSGIGKSTLLHILGGLDMPSAGSLFYDDLALSDLSDREITKFRGKTIGFIFQFHHLLPEFTAVENAAMPLIIRGAGEKRAWDKAAELLSRVGLEKRLSHRPGELSGGEQQRVAIARALVCEPEVLLADEPTGNLDFKTGESVKELLLDLNRDFGMTFIVATHNRELAESMDLVLEMLPGGGLRLAGERI